jgi:hypothetical protein
MGLAEQWRSIRADLPHDWGEVKLDVSTSQPDRRARAAALLGPASPGRFGDNLRVSVFRAGGGIGPDQAEKLFRKLDEERIRGTISLDAVDERVERQEPPRAAAADTWDLAEAGLPPDWSDLLAEVDLASSDHITRAALLLAPLNPGRVAGRSALRFRIARTFGYGASPQMTRRCLERLDAEGIPGKVTVLHVLSDTHNVATQGPVWRLAGKAV